MVVNGGSWRTLDAEFFLNLLSTSKSLFVAVVPNNDIGASFYQRLSEDVSDPASPARDDGRAVAEVEQRLQCIPRHVSCPVWPSR